MRVVDVVLVEVQTHAHLLKLRELTAQLRVPLTENVLHRHAPDRLQLTSDLLSGLFLISGVMATRSLLFALICLRL